VTVRDRDTMKQVRVEIEKLGEYVIKKLEVVDKYLRNLQPLSFPRKRESI
jgi:hypothetical protein